MAKVSAEEKKARLIAALAGARAQVLAAAERLLPAQQDVICLGVWSVHDLVAHLIGWDITNLVAIAEIRAGSLPPFFAEYDADWRTYNGRLVSQHKRASFAETRTAVSESHQRLLDALQALPAGDLARDYGVRSPRGRRVTIAMLIEAEAGDERKHAEQILSFAERIRGAPAEVNSITT